MVTKIAAALIGLSFIAVSGCGDGVTAPSPVPGTTVQATVPPAGPGGPAPTPSPTPTPTPPPPAPPGPDVPPTPPAATSDYYDAEVATVFWQGTPLFGNRFTIEVSSARGELWLNETRLWIVQRNAESIIANDRNPNDPSAGSHTLTATLILKTGQWSFNGLAGSGGGTMRPRESQ